MKKKEYIGIENKETFRLFFSGLLIQYTYSGILR